MSLFYSRIVRMTAGVWKKVRASLVTVVYDDTGEGLLKRPFEDGVLCISLIKHVRLRLGEVVQGLRQLLAQAHAPIFNLYLKTTCSSSELSLGPVFYFRAFQ